MAAIAGTVTYQTVVTVVAASGDGAAVAAMFNSIVLDDVSSAAPTATDASDTVTIVWNQASMRCSGDLAADVVTRMIAANTALTAPAVVSLTAERRMSVS